MGWGQEHIKRAVGPKRCNIGPRLLLRTNTKSHMRFRLAPILVTLDDLERPKGPVTGYNRLSALSIKILTKIDLCNRLQNVGLWILFLEILSI